VALDKHTLFLAQVYRQNESKRLSRRPINGFLTRNGILYTARIKATF